MPIPYDLTVLIPFIVLAIWIYNIGKSVRSNLLAGLFVISVGYFLYDEFSEADTVAMGLRDSFLGMILLSVLSLALSALKKNKRFYWIATIGLVLLSLYMNGVFDAVKGHTFQNYRADQSAEILITFKKPISKQEVQTLTKPWSVDVRSLLNQIDEADATQLDEVFMIDIKEAYDDFKVYEKLAKLPEVDWIEWNENYTIDLPASHSKEISSSFNDPESRYQWSLDVFDINDIQSQTRQIKPKKKAVIAILDTGVDAKHEDLSAVITAGKKHIKDKNGHGTHCAGIAAAVANNGKGIASMNEHGKFLEIMPIQVLSPSGRGTQATILRGIMEAADAEVDVISLSLGGPSLDSRQAAYTDAVKYAHSKGCVVVVAAGNSNRDAKNYTPANVDGVITVTALNSDKKKAYFSNTGSTLKQILAAPGEGIHSTFPGNKYKSFNGTSMATPFVAGVAGMIKSLRPDLSPKEVYDLLNQAADSHADQQNIGKIISPKAALNELLD